MALKQLFFLPKSKTRPVTGASPPDLRLHEIETKIETKKHWNWNKKNFIFQAPSFSKILVARLFMGGP